MPSISSNIKIGNNSIQFHDKIFKLSNMTRSWIFRFQNIEKQKFEKAKREYEKAKAHYEAEKTRKRDENTRNYIIFAMALGFSALLVFNLTTAFGLMLLIAAGICGYMAYRAKMENVSYPFDPPLEKSFPDKFGLGIEMNSGYFEVFTAIGEDGVIALRELQKGIDKADKQQGITIFNMNDNRVTVENDITVESNDGGIISTGDYSDNKIEEREPITEWEIK